MDEDYLRYGVKREGIFSSAMGFMNRLSGFFISLAALLAARIYGFESGEVPGDNPDKAARFMLTIFPFCLVVLGIVVSFFVKFTLSGKRPLLVEEGENDALSAPQVEENAAE